MVCPLLPTTFPDYARVLSSPISRDAIAVERTTVLGALDEFAFDATPIDLVPTAHGLRLQRGDQSIDLPADTTDTGGSVAVNPRYLRDAATHSVGPEIIIELGGPLDTIVCRSADDGTFTTMVMPVKPD